MAKKPVPKSEALSQDGVLNPAPEAVRDDLFTGNPFFDAKDLVQVRYEMVRRHQVDGTAISDAAATFGVTRPTFYKAQNALQTTGLAGLLPSRRGPRSGHKISTEVVAFVADLKTANPALTTFAMCRCDRNAVRNQGAPAQPGTGAGAQKKTNRSNLIVAPSDTAERYETLRAAVLRGGGAACPGLGILHRRGVAEWIRALGQEPPVEVACSDDRLTPLTPHDPAPATSDITRLVAGILVAIAMEPVHA